MLVELLFNVETDESELLPNNGCFGGRGGAVCTKGLDGCTGRRTISGGLVFQGSFVPKYAP